MRGWLWGDRGGESHDDDGTNDARNAKEAQRGTGEDDESAGAGSAELHTVVWVQRFDRLNQNGRISHDAASYINCRANCTFTLQVETGCGCLALGPQDMHGR